MTELQTCPDCGGDCAPECGKHPAGCVFGGGPGEGYWIYSPDCDRDHCDQSTAGEHLGDRPGCRLKS